MTQYPFNISMNVIYTWEFQLSLGYNSLFLPQPVLVSKGNFVLLTQRTGRIAIDTTGNASYSDLVWEPNTQWIKLTELNNWRFYFSALNNFVSYQNNFNIYHIYNNIGEYNITLLFLSSNLSFFHTFYVTNCKLYFYFHFVHYFHSYKFI